MTASIAGAGAGVKRFPRDHGPLGEHLPEIGADLHLSHWQHITNECQAPWRPDIEPRLRRIRGHKHLPQLREAIQRELSRLGCEAQEAGEAEEKEVA
jgi:hypothetical protein